MLKLQQTHALPCIKYFSYHIYMMVSKSWAHQGLNLEPPDYESGALTN